MKLYLSTYKIEFERLTRNTYKFLKNDKYLKSIFSSIHEEKEANELIKKEMIKFTQIFLSQNIKREIEKQSIPINEKSSPISHNDERLKSINMKSSTIMKTSTMIYSQNQIEDKIQVQKPSGAKDNEKDYLYAYDATEFANFIGLPKHEIKSEDILNLILYCSFNLQINCKYI